MKTLDKQVRYCLETWPETRNDDIKLTQYLWYNFYKSKVHLDDNGKGYIYMHDLFELPREDNIKRVRAKIQNEEHKFLPTDFAVMEKRKDASKTWREYLGYDLPATEWHKHYKDDAELEKQLKNALQSEGVGEQGTLI